MLFLIFGGGRFGLGHHLLLVRVGLWWCSILGFSFHAAHVWGVSNNLVDSLSSFLPIFTEWTINAASFQWLCETFGHPYKDFFFSSVRNWHFPFYMAQFPDCKALTVDAFQLD